VLEKRNAKKIGEHWDGRLRVSSTYGDATFDKLDRLAAACGISRTTLQTELITLCLENESIINYIQEKYKNRSRFRIIPSRIDGNLKFIMVEKKK
jgi:hypothetical protein